jgi:hypothetical protein
MRFAYYIPRLAYNEATDEKLVELGLESRFRDSFGRLSHQHITKSQIHARGPDGSSGTWVYPSSDLPPLLWKSDGSWESQPSDNGKFYLCWQKGAKTEPEQLKRRKIITGQNVELLDGKVWHCPTLRRCLGAPNLPCQYERKNDVVSRQVVPSYRAVWEASAKWAAEAFGSGLNEIDLVDIATTCLALNYRVGDEELRILSLFDLTSMTQILRVALDADAVEDLLGGQKKSQETSGPQSDTDTQPGDTDSTQGTEFREAS